MQQQQQRWDGAVLQHESGAVNSGSGQQTEAVPLLFGPPLPVGPQSDSPLSEESPSGSRQLEFQLTPGRAGGTDNVGTREGSYGG